MTPNFVGLFAGGNDPINSLAAQQFQWTARNDQVDSANLARQMAAQQAWREQANTESEAQNRNAVFQAGLDQRAQDNATRAHIDAFNQGFEKYKFGVDTGIRNEANRINDARYQFAAKEKAAQEKTALDTVAKTAQFLAPDVNDYGGKVEASQQTYQDAMARMTTLASELEKGLPPGKAVYNPHVNEFIPVPHALTSPEESKQISEANAKIASAKAIYEAAATTYQTHLNAFDTLRKQAYQNGLEIGKRGGKWIVYSPHHDKTYGADTRNPLMGPPAPEEVPDTTTQPANPFGGSMDISGAGATAGTGTSGYQWGASPVMGNSMTQSSAPTKRWIRDANGKLVLAQ